jgi:DNA-binding transcriptional LysR family regulator
MRKKQGHVADYETVVGDLNDLRAFALTSDLESLTAAAKILGESKATVSRRITRLETALGTALLRRSSRVVEPTDAGVAYRLRVGQVLELLGDANAAAMGGGRAALGGVLRLAAPPGFNDVLARALAGFCQSYPQIVLVVHIAARFVDIEAEHFDVALRATTALADSSLVALRVTDAQIERIVVAAPSYLADHAAPRRPQDLSSHRLLGMGETATTTVTLLHRVSSEKIELRLPLSVAGTELGFIKEMAVSGAGIAILPRMNVARDLRERRLAHLLPSYVAPTVSLFLLHRGGRFVPPKVRAFIDCVRSSLSLTGVETRG